MDVSKREWGSRDEECTGDGAVREVDISKNQVGVLYSKNRHAGQMLDLCISPR